MAFDRSASDIGDIQSDKKRREGGDSIADKIQEDIEKKREIQNQGTRTQELVTMVGTNGAFIGATFTHDDATENNVISNASGTFIGVLIGLGWVFYKKYAPQFLQDKIKIDGPNPWTRRFKTVFLFGQKIGEAVSFGIPFPPLLGGRFTQKILGKILGLGIGLITGSIAVCCFSSDTSDTVLKKYFFGKDSWSKYGKSGFVLGGAIGTLIGGLLGFFIPGLGIQGGALAVSALGGAAGSVLGFVVSIALVPLINTLKPKKNKKENDEQENEENALLPKNEIEKPKSTSTFSNYRTNYFRAGAQLGGSLGTIVGGLLGAFALPVVGALLGSVIGSAAGSMIGGLGYAFIGPYINKWYDPENKAANSADYGIRTGVLFGGTTNTMQNSAREFGPETNVYFGASGAAFGLIGMIREMWHGKKLNKNGKEDKDHILPWTQRAATGVMIGSTVGALIGFAFPPFGFIIGGAVGGLLGGMIACAYEPILRKLNILPSIPKETNVSASIRINGGDSEPCCLEPGCQPRPPAPFSRGNIHAQLAAASSPPPGTGQPPLATVPIPFSSAKSTSAKPTPPSQSNPFSLYTSNKYTHNGTPDPNTRIAYTPSAFAGA